MKEINFTRNQLDLIHLPLDEKLFLEGPAGCGKTTAGVARLMGMLDSGLRGDSILVFVPQRTLANTYYQALHQPNIPAGGIVSVLSISGLAQRMVQLFWPMVAEEAGFLRPEEQPIFLTLETAQYYMARLVQPLMDEGYFASVTIDRNRLYSQILDNLNKSAVVGFPLNQVGDRLKSAWTHEPSQIRVYEDVQDCADRFRRFCLEHNLLDFSLQLDVFTRFLWTSSKGRDYLFDHYQHIIYDNLEEDVPVAHDLLREWLPNLKSALLIYDCDAGYRRFLGADPQSAHELQSKCDHSIVFCESLVAPEGMTSLGERLSYALGGPRYPLEKSSRFSDGRTPSPEKEQKSSFLEHDLIRYSYHRFYPEMLNWVVDCIEELILLDKIPPGEIVVLAPFLSGALRFSLMERLTSHNIPSRSHRPSRSLREEFATDCLLTLATLAHPEWKICPSKFDVAYALFQAIQGMDLIRAQLLTEIVFHVRDGQPSLSSFDMIIPEMQERITYRLGERYEELRIWLNSSRQVTGEFDHFMSRLFGEVLSQPGFGFHSNYDAGRISANLIESIYKFRRNLFTHWGEDSVGCNLPTMIGKEYILTVQEGLIAAQYIESWREEDENSVLLAPAYTFLMRNRPVEIQIWLDIGSLGWFERIDQPLTHPYVLSRSWSIGKKWTDADEMETRQVALYNLVMGLLKRCKRRVYFGLSELGEQGYEQRGPLMQALQRLIREKYGPNE